MADKILLPYQIEALEGIESHKYSVLCWSRQTGKSFALSYYAIKRALKFDRHKLIVISPSERQSKEFMDKVSLHISALKIAKVQFFEDVEAFALEARFPNGSKIIAVPSKPETVRGFTGDVVMDEAAYFEDGFKVYEAVFPTITRRKEFQLIAISTPRSKKDLFYYLWQTAENNPLWFRMKLTIYDAVQRGLDIDVESLRKGILSDEAFRREYLCEFPEEEGAILPYEVIQACEVDPEKILVQDLRELKGEVYIGVDIARRHDLTVISVCEKLVDTLYLRRLEILKEMPFSEQFRIIDHYCYYANKVAIEETGIGMQLAEELQRKWGESKIIPVYFTNKVKEDLAERLRGKFLDRIIRIPADTDLREDLHSVQKVFTDRGNVRYEGSAEDSHADRFWSLALAVYASKEDEYKFPSPIIFASSRLAMTEVR